MTDNEKKIGRQLLEILDSKSLDEAEDLSGFEMVVLADEGRVRENPSTETFYHEGDTKKVYRAYKLGLLRAQGKIGRLDEGYEA